MKQLSLILLCLFMACTLSSHAQESKINYTVNKIWDNGTHSAFPSIIKFKGKFYCTFREGASHIFDKEGKAEGKVRILVSKNGKKWESVALMGIKDIDLRDPKLSISPDGRLMVSIGGSVYTNKVLGDRIPHVSFSEDGKDFTAPEPVSISAEARTGEDWLWRVTWDGDTGYVVNYAPRNNKTVIELLKTTDGKQYELAAPLDVPDFPNETTVRILPDKRMVMMVRREQADRMGYWGISNPPYTEWSWKKMEVILGGPDFIVLDNGLVIAGTRSHYVPTKPKTVLLTGSIDGRFEETLILPSGGDTSYPGFLVEKEELWVCYYSTHETELASIYLAKIPLSLFKKK